MCYLRGFPDHSDKESTGQCRRCRRLQSDPGVGKIPWRRPWQPTLLFLPGESHGQKSLVGYSPWGLKESDTTKHIHTRIHRASTIVVYRSCSEGFDILVVIVDFCQIYGMLGGKVVGAF